MIIKLKTIIIDKKIIDKNIKSKTFDLVDARSSERFLGKSMNPERD